MYKRDLLLWTLFPFLSVGRAVIPNYEQAIQSKQKGLGRFWSVLHEAGKAWPGQKITAKESKESPKEETWVIVDWSMWPRKIFGGRRGSLPACALDCGSSYLGSSPSRAYYIVFFSKTHYSHRVYLTVSLKCINCYRCVKCWVPLRWSCIPPAGQ